MTIVTVSYFKCLVAVTDLYFYEYWYCPTAIRTVVKLDDFSFTDFNNFGLKDWIVLSYQPGISDKIHYTGISVQNGTAIRTVVKLDDFSFTDFNNFGLKDWIVLSYQPGISDKIHYTGISVQNGTAIRTVVTDFYNLGLKDLILLSCHISRAYQTNQ